MPITIVIAMNRLFLKKYITKEHHIKRFNLHSVSFIGVFQGPEIHFTMSDKF